VSYDVACLRPEADFLKVGIVPPEALSIVYLDSDDQQLATTMAQVRAVVIPAVGPKLAPSLFENSDIRLVQVTGSGIDRLDESAMKELGIAVANVTGGSNDAVAEYAIGCALALLRRISWARDHRNGRRGSVSSYG
jgi:phosphoglycerate dehydrogenase-like enzyme